MNKPAYSYPALNYFFRLYPNKPEIQALSQKLKQQNNTDELITLYTHALPLIEKAIWNKGPTDADIKHYQQIFHELESILSTQKNDFRYHFIITIPVADRPEHLNSCLQSLLHLCQTYRYGGFNQGKYSRVRVLIADDSKHNKNIERNIAMARSYSNKGLEVIYFGQNEQKQILKKSRAVDTEDILTNTESQCFYHKGASTTRNISYLKLKELCNNDNKTLFYFIDSDQEFQISTQSNGDTRELYSINYFYYLNEIFSSTDASVLTGKVVGDPPVSPSVMTANFLDDIIRFIKEISETNAGQSCQFHQSKTKNDSDASYHDMADLFGFKLPAASHRYNCNLKGRHNHTQCFTNLSEKLNSFFDGVHPTRKSDYEYKNILQSISPARTVYTGNYILNPQGLKYFIPFARLKLRMAGPTLGRIIKADIGDRFVSANLPMLHRRTISSTGKSEFRPGVNHNRKCRNINESSVDLSTEFGRQFFGDVMLFSIENLTASGYPKTTVPPDTISDTVNDTLYCILEKYNTKHNEIKIKIDTLKKLLNQNKYWWNQDASLTHARQSFSNFIRNIEYNFGNKSAAYDFINSDNNIKHYHKEISAAISNYTNDLKNWEKVLSGNSN
ncbi:two-component sensor histidine kinase [hydrothermal vent metagenome]|uniref:Two-component sensor histidine kinase n=1 Tax=hydrothermal vent metagenome TaxID=652676 RepID=A0A3B0XYI7_9ZZZZ